MIDSPLLKTALHETHIRLGARMVPFGGWDMPVWYSSAREEHAAVRTAAGLFDVSHMGVLDVHGPDACAFLDRVGTNDVASLKVGRSHYSYLLDAAGDVIDDIMIYRVEEQRYLVVVNASNNDKDWAWLKSQHTDDGRSVLRDLRAEASGSEQRVDLALQGPASLPVLLGLIQDATQRAQLEKLPFTGIMQTNLWGMDVFISRTGYTGERVAYEVFVHPAQSVSMWNTLLATGAAQGVKPCGLAARDSLRIEAGLPLYGHELGGPLNPVPFQIGFENFVKITKPDDFVGKTAYLAKMKTSSTRLVRFRMNDKGVRVSKLGDPVLDKRGRVIGTVTSCAADSTGFLCGLALVEAASALEGSQLNVLVLPERLPPALAPFATLGARTLLPDVATVISRFPPRKA